MIEISKETYRKSKKGAITDLSKLYGRKVLLFRFYTAGSPSNQFIKIDKYSVEVAKVTMVDSKRIGFAQTTRFKGWKGTTKIEYTNEYLIFWYCKYII